MSDLFKCKAWIIKDGVELPMDTHMSLKLIVWYHLISREYYHFVGTDLEDLSDWGCWVLVKRHYGRGFYRF